jgi:hypothetical protein
VSTLKATSARRLLAIPCPHIPPASLAPAPHKDLITSCLGMGRSVKAHRVSDTERGPILDMLSNAAASRSSTSSCRLRPAIHAKRIFSVL